MMWEDKVKEHYLCTILDSEFNEYDPLPSELKDYCTNDFNPGLPSVLYFSQLFEEQVDDNNIKKWENPFSSKHSGIRGEEEFNFEKDPVYDTSNVSDESIHEDVNPQLQKKKITAKSYQRCSAKKKT